MKAIKSGPEAWAKGYGVIEHSAETRRRVAAMAKRLRQPADGVPFWDLLMAADRLTSAAMWLSIHDTYAKNVYRDGRPLAKADFKDVPEGHTGSALNMVPGYVGYLVANALTGHTRGWMAEQGHAVSGIDCVNVLVRNITKAHEKYTPDDQGLTRFVRDMYNYALTADSRPESPRGSHVNAHTAGGILEGGYLGFAGLQYVHMPLPGERLVCYLSDGAFEEQRGPDWAPRWWRKEDSGLVAPILICNGRRIDQRTTTSQQGGTKWLKRHLAVNGFDPIQLDGRDPAAFAWAIWEMERRLLDSPDRYPVRLPYGLAETIKGFGIHGAGTNAAHNVPLGQKVDEVVIARFNEAAKRLWVAPSELRTELFQKHKGRPRERDHAMANRDVKLKKVVTPNFLPVGEKASAMNAVDAMFVETCLANPHLRPRVGNPDEMRSNRLERTLDVLKHRVTSPEGGVAEAVDGKVITALNEEAVACAALANKGGINLVHTYEAFGTKMHGAFRQEIIFAHHCSESGRPQRWLSIPLVLTSHTYENGKNEQSHQDPSMCEALMGEPAGVSRVVFPADANSAAATMEALYQTQGQFWTVVVPKRDVPVAFDGPTARRLVQEAAVKVLEHGTPRILLTAIGAYQLIQVLKASQRLAERGVGHRVIYLFEPRRFAEPRDREEREQCVTDAVRGEFYPPSVQPRLYVTHTRAGRIQGLLQVIDTGPKTLALGYRNEGGTLNIDGMLWVNHQSWAHVLHYGAKLLGTPREKLLSADEMAAIDGARSPNGVIFA